MIYCYEHCCCCYYC